MKFGIMNLFPGMENVSDYEVFHNTLAEIQLADELGFDSVWLAEHHFSRYGILGSPLTFGMAIADRTKNITIGTAVLVLPFYDPVRIAEDVATLDVLSSGRVTIGVGRGYQPKEFAGFRTPAEESRARYNEIYEILKLALREENWSYDGQYYQYENMTTYPRPYTPGGPPLLQGTVSPESFSERGRAGEGIITSPNFTPLRLMKRNFELYREGMLEGGHDITQYDIPFMQQVWAGHGEDGLRQAATATFEYYRSLDKVIPGAEEALVEERDYYEKVAKNLKLLTLEQTLTHGGNFGSPQQVIETIELLHEELGVTHYIGWLRIPYLERTAALKSMETFATEVIPYFRKKDQALEPEPVAAPASGLR